MPDITNFAMCDLDVSAGNFTIIDWDIHQLWLNGYTSNEAVQYLKEVKISDFRREFPAGVSHELLLADVADNYRLFGMIESSILSIPHKSSTHPHHLASLQFVDSSTKQRLVEAYYSLDSSLCREILGKKLSSRLRKDLDEVSDRTGVRLKSCRRQFDNIKRIFKVIEDMPGHYVKNIETQFGLGRSVAEKYATLVFASSFRLEMSRRKLSQVTFDEVMAISLMIMDMWMEHDDVGEPSLDKDFVAMLRELRTIQDREKEHKSLLCQRLAALNIDAKFRQEIESNFKTLNRNILYLAQYLSSQKELKEFFIILVEKIIESLRQLHLLTKTDLDMFLRSYTDAITENAFCLDNDTKQCFAKYMLLMRPAILVVFKQSQ